MERKRTATPNEITMIASKAKPLTLASLLMEMALDAKENQQQSRERIQFVSLPLNAIAVADTNTLADCYQKKREVCGKAVEQLQHVFT